MNKRGYVTIETLLAGSLIIGLGAYSTVKYINHSKGLANSSISRLNVNFDGSNTSSISKKEEQANYVCKTIDDAYIDEAIKNLEGNNLFEIFDCPEYVYQRPSQKKVNKLKELQERYLNMVKSNDENFNGIQNGKQRYKELLQHKGNIVVTNYNGSETDINIPSSINGKSVYAIDKNTIFNGNNLVKATFNGDTVCKYSYRIIGDDYLNNSSYLRGLIQGIKMEQRDKSEDEIMKEIDGMIKQNKTYGDGFKDNMLSGYKKDLETVKDHKNEIIIDSIMGNASSVKIPDSINGHKVYKVNEGVFIEAKNLQNVILPNGTVMNRR